MGSISWGLTLDPHSRIEVTTKGSEVNLTLEHVSHTSMSRLTPKQADDLAMAIAKARLRALTFDETQQDE